MRMLALVLLLPASWVAAEEKPFCPFVGEGLTHCLGQSVSIYDDSLADEAVQPETDRFSGAITVELKSSEPGGPLRPKLTIDGAIAGSDWDVTARAKLSSSEGQLGIGLERRF